MTGFSAGESGVGVDLLLDLGAFVEAVEAVAELADGAGGEILEIAHRVPGVLAAELDLSGEGQVVANKDPGAGDEAGRVGLVVTVAQADDPGVIRARPVWEPHLDDSEVAGSFMTEGVDGCFKLEAGAGELGLDLADEIPVGEWEPGAGRSRGRDGDEFVAGDRLASAVEEHPGNGNWWRGSRRS
jgi:hypothetical protein